MFLCAFTLFSVGVNLAQRKKLQKNVLQRVSGRNTQEVTFLNGTNYVIKSFVIRTSRQLFG
jgi:hypothetical protein